MRESDFCSTVSFFLCVGQKKCPVINAKEVAVENRAEETYYHRTI
jgi:hypothetical protein